MKAITQFTFDQAQYELEDTDGNKSRLHMNYKDNTYEIEGVNTELIQHVAEDLLKKKHAVNFAYKFTQYTLE